jgi:hypothetical protein
MSTLILERREQQDETGVAYGPGSTVLLTPPIGEDYWTYRVRVGDGQAIIGFPKYGTIGVGFAVEEDWNTNLPVPFASPEDVYEHIKHNKGDDSISDEDCIEAIRMITAAVEEDAA